jgi:hypothetical protein
MLVNFKRYAYEFSNTVNASKTECILFTPPGKRSATVRPDLYNDSSFIAKLLEWLPLGNIISVTQTDYAGNLLKSSQFNG